MHLGPRPLLLGQPIQKPSHQEPRPYSLRHRPRGARQPMGARFGFHVPTHTGMLPQDNTWTSTWEEFFARILRQNMDHEARIHGRCEEMDALSLRLLAHVVPRLLRPLETDGRSIRPAFCHGDLHFRNVMTDVDSGSLVTLIPIDAGHIMNVSAPRKH